MNGASLMARLGLDTSGFTGPLRNAGSEADKAHGRMAQGARRNASAHDDLWKSENKIENQINKTARTLLSGASASEVYAQGIESIGKSLNLSLGAIALIGTAAIGVEKIGAIRAEMKKLAQEIDEITKGTGPIENRSLASIETAATKASAALKKLREEQTSGNSVYRYIGDFFRGGDQPTTAFADPVGFQRQRREKQIGALREVEGRSLSDIAKKKEQELDIAGSSDPEFIKKARSTSREFQEKIGETGTPGSPKENQLLSMQLRRELEQALTGIAESVSAKRRERVQLSLGDLAENGAGYGSNMNMQAIYNAEQAREAKRLEEQARQQSLAGDLNGAQSTMNRADEIKRGIGTLKDSEKDLKGELTGALDASTVLQEIRDRVTFTGN